MQHAAFTYDPGGPTRALLLASAMVFRRIKKLLRSVAPHDSDFVRLVRRELRFLEEEFRFSVSCRSFKHGMEESVAYTRDRIQVRFEQETGTPAWVIVAELCEDGSRSVREFGLHDLMAARCPDETRREDFRRRIGKQDPGRPIRASAAILRRHFPDLLGGDPSVLDGLPGSAPPA